MKNNSQRRDAKAQSATRENRGTAYAWLNPKLGAFVFVNNIDSVLHGLRAKVVGLNFICADLDFECDIKVPGQAPLTQRIWRIPLDELLFNEPDPKPSRNGRS
jgi:hypothetical protein